jgi:hypothetical protein
MTPPRLSPTAVYIRKAVEEWNQLPGEVWDIRAEVDDAALQRCFTIADTIFGQDPFPDKPGPFKLMAAFSLAVQYSSPFRWSAGPRSKYFSDDPKHWEPRLTVWILPYLSELLLLGANSIGIPVMFPTPHLQLEAINYLRIVHQSKQGTDPIDLDHLTEQVLLFGLCLEGSSYASFPDVTRLAPIMKHAEKCVYPNTDLRWPDQHFMDQVFFETYFEADSLPVD